MSTKGEVQYTTGQTLHSLHWQCWREGEANIRAKPSLSTKIANVKSCAHEKVDEGYAQFHYHFGIAKDEQSVLAGGFVPGGLDDAVEDDGQKQACANWNVI